MFMFDGAYAAPLLAQCKAAGGVAMSHYLTGLYVTTSAQVSAIRAAGVGAVLNYEVGAAELVNATRAQGQAVGMRAVNAVDPGCPRDGTVGIYFSVDTQVPAGQLTACDAAFAGIRDVLHGEFRVKLYGESALIEHLCGRGLVDGKQWLSESTFNMPYVLSPNVCMVQNHDAAGNWFQSPVPNTDVNTILDVHALDAWWPPGSPYLNPQPSVKEPTMFAATTVADGAGKPIPVASQIRCVFGPGLHAHNDPITAGVVARVADAGGINLAQHDHLASAVAIAPAVPAPVDAASVAADLAAHLNIVVTAK